MASDPNCWSMAERTSLSRIISTIAWTREARYFGDAPSVRRPTYPKYGCETTRREANLAFDGVIESVWNKTADVLAATA